MCGITGAVIRNSETSIYWKLLQASEIRGQDSTGVMITTADRKEAVWHCATKASLLLDKTTSFPDQQLLIIGQNRFAMHGLHSKNDQPLLSKTFGLVHNGNLFDFVKVFKELNLPRDYEVDSELILRLIEYYFNKEEDLPSSAYLPRYQAVCIAIRKMFPKVKGDFACLLLDKQSNRLYAFRKYMPLYSATYQQNTYFFSTEVIGREVFPASVDFLLVPALQVAHSSFSDQILNCY